MSWHYSRALVAEYSEASSVDSVVSAPLKSTHTQGPSLLPDKTMARSRRFRSGMMSAPFAEMSGEELLTWYLAAFPVKIFQSQAKAQESTAQSLDSGEKWQGSFAKWNQDSSSWKTPQPCLFGDLMSFSVTWPKWGLMQDGVCLEQTMLALPTYESACLSLLPTLTVCGNNNRKGASKTSGDGLPTHLRLRMPTLTAHDSKGCAGPGQLRRNSPGVSGAVGGPPNPTWCEWFMGFPLGWTALEGLETLKFLPWLNSHGIR